MERVAPTRMISNRLAARVPAASWCLFLVASALAFGPLTLGAQGTPNVAAKHVMPSTKPPSHHKNSPAKPTAVAPVPDPPPASPAPEMPKWPVNDAPAPASVKWDSHGLQVDANNSSLHQILDDVATTTGAKVEGLGPDERVFGDFGPGPAREVLSQILHGSTYNVMMLGDQGEGTPREIILSERTNGSPQQPGQPNVRPMPQDDDSDQPPMPEPEEPNRQPVVPPMNQQMNMPNQPGGPMTPQQRLLEMQRQQMQMQQQQQQNQPVPPPQE